ncbi:carbohydrate esterase family 15 protein [Xylariomycetidae sp. FL0641]|nr:carbohydrate esterase family 15 protein [Xylariomycetidae sp. FL0641]
MKSTIFGLLGLAALSSAQEYEPTPTGCTIPTSASYPTSTKLPDPFLRSDGERLTTAEDWACKRAEIRDQIQRYELGTKPPKPTVSATYSGSTINVAVSEGGKSASFSVGVKVPSGNGPFPALITFEGTTLPVSAGVATLTFPNHDVAADDPHGKGKFYDVYGSDHPAGSLMAWAWGVSRVVDALEQLGAEATKIDAARLGVTGCSRNGKGALVAGAFDDRIALTLPQEGGSGGPGCWRIVAGIKANGTKTEDATQIVQGDAWFAETFQSYAPDVSVLPYDHHMLMALVAPRGLLVIENSGIDYLGPVSTYGCSVAARMVYESLGVQDAMGVSQASHGNSHCSMPSSQNAEVAAFMSRFLLGQEVDTDVVKTDGTFTWYAPMWIDWEVESLT